MTGSGVTSTILPIVIVPVILLFAWLSTVIYMAGHPARRGRDEQAPPRGDGQASRPAPAAPGTERAGAAGGGERGAPGGAAGGRGRAGGRAAA